uniref:Dynactin subunit 6 n=1 Tax=Heterorhabditis bacteriophora TaxID=37862 RepID=A0A1I7XGN8_HETBA
MNILAQQSLSPLYACTSCGHFFIRDRTILGRLSRILHTVDSVASMPQVPRISVMLSAEFLFFHGHSFCQVFHYSFLSLFFLKTQEIHKSLPGALDNISNLLHCVTGIVRALSIGNNNVLHVQCLINTGSQLGDGCSIGARCEILEKESLPNKTVIYGQKNERRIASDNPPVSNVNCKYKWYFSNTTFKQIRRLHRSHLQTPLGQLEIFRKLIPSYHYLRRTITETKTNY